MKSTFDCIICHTPTGYYFSKHFGQFGLLGVDYWRCPACGFVVSRTHVGMPAGDWEQLNARFHKDSAVMIDNPNNRPPPYFEQALMLHLLRVEGFLPNGQWLDWGSGDGKLSVLLDRYFSQRLINFDRFLTAETNSLREQQLEPHAFSVVVSSAVFEHVRCRETLDEIESCVAPDGVLAVHTLVRGEIPQDPQWMYLLPVHCAFHTNRSMQILMNDWGYTCSVYSERSKIWVMFRANPDSILEKVKRLNRILGWEYLHFKQGFMDYWP